MAEIGNKIKEIRIKKGLSQNELAEAAKVNIRTIQRIENNDTTPRGNTLKLIFTALEIETIQQNQTTINKQLIWLLFLTLLIFIGSFLGWVQFISDHGINFKNTGPELITTNGWKGNLNLNNTFTFYNWLVTLSALSIAALSIFNSLGLVKKKIIYILVQLIFIASYLFVLGKLNALFGNHSKYFALKPGLFIVITATILLAFSYFKKEKKPTKHFK